MSKNFLEADWRKLIMANYIIDPDLLTGFIPHGTELDFFEDKTFVSLVGFMFYNTKVLKITVPFHKNFEEVNLRFYVRYNQDGEWKRGVVFIKEIVPLKTISLIANHLYKEHYQTLPMKHNIREDDKVSVSYHWDYKKRWNSLSVLAEKESLPIQEGTEQEFITEHYWGYTRVSDTKTSEYEVVHPKWQHYPVLDYDIDVDFKTVYGEKFGFLSEEKPSSVLLAEGSWIAVKKGQYI